MEIRRLINNQPVSKDHQPSKSGSTNNNMQKKKAVSGLESRRVKPELQVHVPDLTDFMNDMFFGTLNNNTADRKKAYNLTGHDHGDHDDRTAEDSAGDSEEDQDLDEGSSRRSISGRSTQEWLEEARRLVASSPSRGESPSRRVGSPRFAAAAQGASPASVLDRRDPLSRSARRHRAVESFSGEIISKSAKHGRNKSETFASTDAPDSPSEPSPAASVHQWFSNILKPANPAHPPPPEQPAQPPASALSGRQSFPRKSRFQQSADPSSPRPQGIPTPRPGRPNLLTDPLALSPPKNLVESAQRRSVSSSTCSSEKIVPPKKPSSNGSSSSDLGLNGFLKKQRTKLADGDAKARIVLSGPSNTCE